MADGARRPTVTIRDVAAAAGVSLQTVSRVINNGPNVRAAVKLRVDEAVAQLGYVPSLAARRLGGSRSYLILALNDRDRTIAGWRSGEGTDWVDQMLLGGMLTCAEHGYRMIFELVDTHAANVEREVRAALAALRPDGVILTPPHSDTPQITELLSRLGVPFARIGSTAEGDGFAIYMDEAGAAEAATGRLIELGHRRIGFIAGSAEYALSEARVAGYRQALGQAGIAVDEALVERGDFGFASGAVAAHALLDLAEPPSALVASSDQMAVAATQVAQGRGLRVPEDLSVVSFDDTPVVRYAVPPLTAVVQPIAAMAARAAEVLIVSKAGREQPARHLLPFTLAMRGSTARHAG